MRLVWIGHIDKSYELFIKTVGRLISHLNRKQDLLSNEKMTLESISEVIEAPLPTQAQSV